MVLLCMIGLHTAQAKTEKVYATFENPSNTNTTWNAETKTFTWSTTYYNQLRNIGLPTGDITKYKKLVVDCEIKSGDQFRILFYKGGSNKTLYASNGVNEFILADTLKALYPDDFNEFLLQCDEICLSGNNAVAPGEAVINAVYLETYDDEGEKVYATFENPSNTNTTWNAETKTFTWSTTYYNQLRNIGLPNGDITKYKKLVVDCEIKSGDQFRVLFYKGGSNKTLYASNGVNEFILADTLKALYPDDYNEFLLQCDEICLSGNNAVAPGEAVINAVYLETYPENESVEIPDITYEEDPGKPAGEFVDFTEAFPALQPRIGLGTDGHPIVLGNGEVVVGQRTKDVIADLSDYSKLTIVTSPNLKLVVYMNHEVDAQQNAGDYSEDDAGKYVFLDIQANENGIAEIDLTQYDKQDLNCICLPWDNNNKGTVWYLLLTAKPAADDVLPIDIQFGADYNDEAVSAYTKTWTATKDGKTWTLVNFNNNNNAWASVKCGRKNAESVASITSPAINAVVTNYVVSVAKASNVNSAKLTIMNGDTQVGEDIDITANFVAGDVNVPVESQKGYSYKLTIDNASASANGSVEITKIALYGEGQYIDVHIANTIDNPYTVANAFELIDAGQALNEVVFVKGIISKIDSINAEQAFITYWISADGTAEGQQLQCYKGKTLEGVALADIEVGAEVIVKGNLKKYGETYEFDANNEIAAYKAPVKPLFADGKYYILNKGTQKYLAAGAAWGTHAVVNADGLDYGIAFVDGKYTLDSNVSNGGNSHFLNGEWNDGAAMGWIFTPVEGAEGLYTISNGTNFLTAQADDQVLLQGDATAEAAQWMLKTLDERIAELATATAEAPVNATFLIQDANFGRNDLRKSAWTMVANNQNLSGGNNTNNNAESFHSVFTLSQVLANAPAGKYQMTAQGFYRQDGSDNENLPVFYANDKTATFPEKTGTENSMSDASASFTAGSYTIEPIAVTVFEDGQLTVGAKLENNTNLWCIFDNFRLTYLTKDIPAEEFKPAYEAALAAAQAALADVNYAAVTGQEKTALEKAIADYGEIAEPTTELYKAAISALNAATSAFTAAKADYEALIAAKAAEADFDFAPYPYASEAKIAAAKATLTAEATSGADAKAKAQGIFNAFRTAVESNAMLEATYGVVNHSDSIAGANADQNNGWTSGSIGTNQGQGYTDGDGVVCGKYLDGGWSGNAGVNIDLVREVNLPAGKFILTATARGSADLTEYTMTIAGQTVDLPHIGAGANDGVFGNGWNDAYVIFETTGEPVQFEIKAKSDAYQNWISINRFRIAQFGVAGEDAPELEAPEGWTNEIANGNLAGDNVANYFAKEYPSTEIVNASIVAMAGKDNSRGIVVKAGDDTANSGAQAWDSQFWIQLNEKLPDGTKLHVEFDYKASKAAKASTQAHGAPGAYLHWAMIGDVNFTTEWQHFSTDVTVEGSMANMESIAFNLQEEKSATEYYFDNFGVWAQKPAPIEDWTDIVVNGDMEGADMVNFFVTEQGVGGPFVATATEGIGKDGSKAVKVQSADSPAQDWDTQFFIRLPYQLPAGTKYKVSFDYKADKAGDFDTQAHAEPGQYIHWAMIGSGSFTTEWQTYTAEGSVPAECDGSTAQKTFQTIAFNLAKNKVATEFIFDNVKFEVPANIVETLVLNPYVGKDADELQAPDGWTKAIANGNLAGDDVTSFVSKEYPSTEIVGARIVAGAGKDYSRGIVVKAGDDTGNDAAVAWDSQFWIQLNEKLPEGSKVHIEFDYKASQAAKASTQAHSDPGNYLHWAMMGDVNFTTEWQHFSADVDVTAAMAKGGDGNGSGDGLFSIAFNLQEEKSATDYFFDNFGVWYQLPVVDGINAMKNEMNAKSVYNLNGQKVNVTKKGLYIMNGKKVVVK